MLMADIDGDADDDITFIRKKIKQDPLAADLKWSLFMAALMSYRFDSVLKPFPPMFQDEQQEKDMKLLERVAEGIPSIKSQISWLESATEQVASLLRWVLDSKTFSIKTVDKSKFTEIIKRTECTVEVPEPNYIFEVIPSEIVEEKFERRRDGRNLMYAYHGSRIENFHSILHNGLASHMNKVSVFGEGTYLSSELSVSLHYSPTGLGWDRSQIGNRISCIAVCEMIDDPAVKCQNKTQENGSSKSSKSRAIAGRSEGGEVPEKYYVVQNNEVIRVKYLLIYAQKSHTQSSNSSIQPSWFQRHKFAVMMFIYFIILCVIGILNSKSVRHQIKKFWKSR